VSQQRSGLFSQTKTKYRQTRHASRQGTRMSCCNPATNSFPTLDVEGGAYRQPQFCRHPDAQEGGMEQEEPAGQDTLF